MPSYDVALIQEKGDDLIIVPVDSAFGSKTHSEQRRLTSELQKRAGAAGLAGTVVPVWDAGDGRMAFICQVNWLKFFESINLDFVRSSVNRRLEW
jgi:hypothetical protein